MNIAFELQKLSPKRGDIIVLTIPKHAFHSVSVAHFRDRIFDTLQKLGFADDVQVLIIDSDMSLQCVPVVDLVALLDKSAKTEAEIKTDPV